MFAKRSTAFVKFSIVLSASPCSILPSGFLTLRLGAQILIGS